VAPVGPVAPADAIVSVLPAGVIVTFVPAATVTSPLSVLSEFTIPCGA